MRENYPCISLVFDPENCTTKLQLVCDSPTTSKTCIFKGFQSMDVLKNQGIAHKWRGTQSQLFLKNIEARVVCMDLYNLFVSTMQRRNDN
jgi:hypothetical protein